jgi:hypothetical protein
VRQRPAHGSSRSGRKVTLAVIWGGVGAERRKPRSARTCRTMAAISALISFSDFGGGGGGTAPPASLWGAA